MARLARVVLPGIPHHVTRRGNGRQQTFFGDGDYALYRDLLADACREVGVEVWACCLMPNHVHLILVPEDADGLWRALAPVRSAPMPAPSMPVSGGPGTSGRAGSARWLSTSSQRGPKPKAQDSGE